MNVRIENNLMKVTDKLKPKLRISIQGKFQTLVLVVLVRQLSLLHLWGAQNGCFVIQDSGLQCRMDALPGRHQLSHDLTGILHTFDDDIITNLISMPKSFKTRIMRSRLRPCGRVAMQVVGEVRACAAGRCTCLPISCTSLSPACMSCTVRGRATPHGLHAPVVFSLGVRRNVTCFEEDGSPLT
jgi:hypothetical protein